jgi:hypothetical protein
VIAALEEVAVAEANGDHAAAEAARARVVEARRLAVTGPGDLLPVLTVAGLLALLLGFACLWLARPAVSQAH